MPLTVLLGALLFLPPQDAGVAEQQPFAAWLDDFIAEARSRGIDETLLTETFAGLEPLPHVVRSDRNQAEVRSTFQRYLSTRVTRPTVQRGQDMGRQYATLLTRIENSYSVQRRFILAIWGLESRYGRNIGRTPVFQALATLAWEPRRSAFFREQLFDALMMVSLGHIDAASMTGSWAGAMGQTQFMPSSYLRYAVDFDADGRRDIWRSTADALASIASYLKGHGWNDEQTWGREVKASALVQRQIEEAIPMRTDGCSAMRLMTERQPLSTWQRLGVRQMNGAALPAGDLPAGFVTVGGRTFLLYTNYDALLRYNCAHYYALSVAMLADRIR